MATFPWHLVKALLLAIPRILLLVIIYMAGTAVATAALALPVHTISWYFTADWGIPVPLLNDVPFSASGLALGGFMAKGGGRGTVLFTIWAIITVALCAMPILGMPINWMPFA